MRPGSKAWKNFMAKLYGIGAAVVIVGALFKIQHWPLADVFLILGLSTEAIIFMFSAFEPPHEDPDWSLVYPELATGEHAAGDDFNMLCFAVHSRKHFSPFKKPPNGLRYLRLSGRSIAVRLL